MEMLPCWVSTTTGCLVGHLIPKIRFCVPMAAMYGRSDLPLTVPLSNCNPRSQLTVVAVAGIVEGPSNLQKASKYSQ